MAAATLVLSACTSNDVGLPGAIEQTSSSIDQTPIANDPAVVVEIEYTNSGSEPIAFDIIRVEWTDGSMLESASFLDGVDLGISGQSPAQGSIEAAIPEGTTDWLSLSFDTEDAPEGLTVTMVTSTGATLTFVPQG